MGRRAKSGRPKGSKDTKPRVGSKMWKAEQEDYPSHREGSAWDEPDVLI